MLPKTDLLGIDEEQRRDSSLSAIIDDLSVATPATSSGLYSLHDNVLYRRNFRTAGSPRLLVIPKHLRNSVLRELHDAPASGHLGILRTYTRLKERFYWNGMYKSVQKYVTACDKCQRRKTPSLLPAEFLNPLSPPPAQFYRVGVDLLGPFPCSSAGNPSSMDCGCHRPQHAVC